MKQVFASKSTIATLRRAAAIREWLLLGEGMTIKELSIALGISRQLTLYHVKKMAAAGMCVMQLEPCVRNGGVRFRVWDEMCLARSYIQRFGMREVRRAA